MFTNYVNVRLTPPQHSAASAPQLGQVQVGGGRRERAGAGPDPGRHATHAAVQVHAALGAGRRRAAGAAAARARAAARPRQARPGQLGCARPTGDDHDLHSTMIPATEATATDDWRRIVRRAT